MMYTILKHIHMACAVLSISGFALRGYWMLTDNPRLRQRLTRILPHTIDTLLLLSAIGMLVILQLNPLAVSWLAAKLLALLAYIGFGMVAMRFGRNKPQRTASLIAALACAAYILSVALSKQAAGWFA